LTKVSLMRGFAAGKTMYEITNTFFLSPFFSPTVPIGLRDFLRKDVEWSRIRCSPCTKEAIVGPCPPHHFGSG
jgi:hypothetical protein